MKKLEKTAIWLKRHFTLSNIANISSIITVLVVPFFLIIKPWLFPTLSINCPPEIRTNEVNVFGKYSAKNCAIALYVHPMDGKNNYWIQTFPTLADDNIWNGKVKLGNPFGKGHVKEPPLDYEIICVLIENEEISSIPGYNTNGEIINLKPGASFIKLMRSYKAKKVEVIKVRRNPENCLYIAEMISPKQPFNPRENTEVYSPVTFEWKPDIPMYIELRKNNPEKAVYIDTCSNKRIFDLKPGLYELKVKENRDSECSTDVWFMVLHNKPK